jgi:hypothetical protein
LSKNVTKQLILPHIAYASIIKRILIDVGEDLSFIMIMDIKHPSIAHIIGPTCWKFVQEICHEFKIVYSISGIYSISLRILSDNYEKYKHICFSIDRHPTIESIIKIYDNLMKPIYKMRIYKEDVEKSIQNVSWNYFKQIFTTTDHTMEFTIYDDFIECAHNIGTLKELHNTLRIITSIRLSKPSRHWNGLWLKDSWYKWRYFACVIREFCMATYSAKIPMNTLKQIILWLPISDIHPRKYIIDSIVYMFASFTLLEQKRCKK